MSFFGSLFRPDIAKLEEKRDVASLIKAISDNNLRAKAKAALIRLGSVAETHLLKALHDSDENVVATAIAVLGEIESHNAVPKLIPFLDNSRFGHDACMALCTIARTYPRIPVDLTDYAVHRNEQVRYNVAQILGYSSDAAVDILLPMLDDREAFVVRAVVGSLGRMLTPRVHERLLEILFVSKDKEVHERIIKLLKCVEPFDNPQTLIKLLASSYFDVRWFGMETIARLPVVPVEALREVLRQGSEKQKELVALALQRKPCVTLLPELVATLDVENSDTRDHVVKALVALGDTVVGKLVEVYLEVSPCAQASIARVFRELKAAEAAPLLVDSLEQAEDADLISSLLYALSIIKFEGAIESICMKLSSSNPRIVAASARALEQMGYEQAAPKLIEALSHKNEEARASIASALRISKSSNVVNALLGCLKDPSSSVRFYAVTALKAINDPSSYTALEAHLNSEKHNPVVNTIQEMLSSAKPAASPYTVSVYIDSTVGATWTFFTKLEPWEEWWGGSIDSVEPGWVQGGYIHWKIGRPSQITSLRPQTEIEIESTWSTALWNFVSSGSGTCITYTEIFNKGAQPQSALKWQTESMAMLTKLKVLVENI